MRKKISIGTALVLVMLSAVTTFNITFVACQDNFNSRLKTFSQMEKNYDKLAEVQAFVDQYFVGKYDSGDAMEMALSGYIAGLGDKWSHYLTAKQYAEYKKDLTDQMVGIGVSVGYDASVNGLRVIDVYDNSPAAKAGVEFYDAIISVDGTTVAKLGYSEAMSAVRGEANTSVKLTLLKYKTNKTENVTISRENFKKVIVKGEMLENNVGYVRIRDFDMGAEKQFEAAVNDLLSKGAKSLVFDVRNNPGGAVDAMKAMLDMLLPEGDIITLKSKDDKNVQVLKSDASEIKLPMSVIVNDQSISAAEFFSAALQEYGKAVVVGEKTGGKGYSQYPFELSDGSAIIMSNNTYYTPKGRSLVPDGVTPDKQVSLSEEQLKNFYLLTHEEDTQLKAAVDALK